MTSILDRHHERFQATPGDNQAFEALEEHHFLASAWNEVIALYEHRLTAPALQANPTERAQLRFRMGQVFDEHLGDSDRALECYAAALRDDPQNRPALMQLRRNHAARGNWDVALQIADVEIELPMPAAERATLLCELGLIWLDRLDDPEQALTQFERALSEQPGRREALEGSARAYERCGRHSEAAQVWDGLARQLKGPARAAARVFLARLAAGPLGQAERAKDLYRSALGDDPDNRDAIRAVAAQAEARGQWPVAADLLERQFERATDDGERAEAALRLGRLHDQHLGNPSAARLWLSRALEIGAEDAGVYEALADLDRARGDGAALLKHLERAVALRGEAAPAELLLEVASLYAGRGDDERALTELQRAALRAPEDPRVAQALAETLSRLGRDEELADALERRASMASGDPEACSAALAELGALHEERLDDVEAALHAYERAFQTNPCAPGIAGSLERLYRKLEAWKPLRDFLEIAGHEGPPEERIKYLCSLGAVEIDHFGDSAAAARALETALAIDPADPVAHRGLQHLASRSGDEDATLRAYQREAEISIDRARLAFLVTEIRRILEARGQPRAALGWVRRWVEACPEDPRALSACADLQELVGGSAELVSTLEKLDGLLATGEQAANRRRLGDAHAAAGRIDAAISAYRSALESDPADADALEAAAFHLEAQNRLEELAQARRQLADLLPSPRRAECLDQLAGLLAERLGDIDGAIEILTRLAAEESAPADVHERLESMLERGERFDELAEQLARRVAGLDEGDSGAAALELRRARVLLDHLGRCDDAAAAYRSVTRRDPSAREAREGLERALRGSGNVAALAEFLAEQMRDDTEPDARDRCAFERAVLLEDCLDATGEAREELRRLASEAREPGLRRHAAERLEALLERSGAWQDLRAHLEAVLADADDGDEAGLRERLGQLCRDRLDDADSALAHFQAAADLTPTSAKLWRDLAQLYEATGRTAELVDALEAELATRPDRDRELSLRIRAAEIYAATLGDPGRAHAHYTRVLELDPTHATAAEFLINQCERAGDTGTLVQLLETRLTALDGAPRDQYGPWAAQRTSLRVRIADLRASALDDLDGAIAVLEPALGEIGPKSVVAGPLADLYGRAGYREDLIDLCRNAAAVCDARAERANWFVRLGDALRDSGRDRDAAAAYRKALTDRPDDREVQAALRGVYRRLREDSPLARLLEVELSRLAGADEVPVRLELAQLLAGSQDRPDEALIHLRRVIQIDPGHGDAMEQALALAERMNECETVLELLDGALAEARSRTARAALLARRGNLLAKNLDRPEEAIAALREALALDGTRTPDRVTLRTLLAARKDWKGVLDCLFQEASAAEPEARGDLFERAADIAWEHLSPEAALPWLERLRHERPRDPTTATRICEVHRRADRPEALLRALEDAAAVTAHPRDLHLERAHILETRLGSPARSVTALEHALRAAPGDVQTLERLERSYRRAGRHRERARVLEALVESRAGESRVALLCDAASLYQGPLADPRRAAEYLLTAVAESRGSAIYGELLRGLGDALCAAGRTDAWARCAEEELRVLDAESPVLSDRRRELQRDLAAAYEHELGRPDAALRHLRALVALKWTETHGTGTEDLDAIENALLRLLRGEKNWVELGARLAAHVERRSDDADAWRELARLREERLRTPAAAAAAYRAVLEHRPGDSGAIRGLRRCSELVGDWEAVAEALQLELAGTSELSATERSALLRRLGDVCWQRLGSTTRASRSYASALETDPQDFDALRALQRLLEAMEDWRGALDLYESEVEMLGDREPERRRVASLRAGEIARDHTGEPQRALRSYVYAAGIGELPAARRAELAELHRTNGDAEAFAEVFAHWCDDASAGASAEDHLRLAEVLEELARDGAARDRIERAVALDAESARVWDAAARLRERCGDPAGAAEALRSAAALLPDAEAAPRLLRAAELREPCNAEDALSLLRAAARRDPGSAAICAALTRVCADLGDFAEAVEMASRALDLGEASGEVGPELRLETALIAARAARQRGKEESAARFYASALAVEPEHPEALAGYGETLAGLGDLPSARSAIEALLALDAEDDRRGLHLTMLGAAMAATGEWDAARERLEEAIALDPDLDRAHEELVQLHERSGRIDEGIACLERWADRSREPSERARRLRRAAEWEMRTEGSAEGAERNLRKALEVDPDPAVTWDALATLLWEQGRGDRALDVASSGLNRVTDAGVRGRLALIRGRALEQRGDRREAAEAFSLAATENPRCIEGALSSARLLRALGEWRPAAEILGAFAERHPGDDAKGLADVLQQLGRLLGGPLEDVDGAILAYRRAVEIDPARVESRAALAELLSHSSDGRNEALAHHRAILASDPTHAPSLRLLMRLARESGDEAAIAGGNEILRALGLASPREIDEAQSDTVLTFAGDRKLADPLGEKLRQIANVASREIATALESSDTAWTAAAEDPASAFRAAAMAAEAQITASALIPLTVPELGEVLKLTAAVALDPDHVQGDGRLVNAISSAIGRRLRRRLRRILDGATLEAIEAVDFAAWRAQVRALAAAVALDETGGDLRTALVALIAEDSDHELPDLPDAADLTPYVAAYPRAQSLMQRIVRTWLERL